MSNPVFVLGIDIGSTTSSILIAKMTIVKNIVTGKVELLNKKVVFQSEPVFTPFNANRLDAQKIGELINDCFSESGLKVTDIFSSGVLLTGLAAKSENASVINSFVRSLIPNCLIARADDPGFESWLAFMGSCRAISLEYPNREVLNLDIGGGTTNPGFGINGDVFGTGCYFIGARHFRFIPGTYVLEGISKYGLQALDKLGIKKSVTQELGQKEIDLILDYYMQSLEAIVDAQEDFFKRELFSFLEQIPFSIPKNLSECIITFSGGVGELVYRIAERKSVPGKTFYGDLGIDLAVRIFGSVKLNKYLCSHIPLQKGRATVYGITMSSIGLAGMTLYLPNSKLLPLADIPILGQINFTDTEKELFEKIGKVCTQKRSICFRITEQFIELGLLKYFCKKMKHVLAQYIYSQKHVLVLLTGINIGKTLGNYLTDWGTNGLNLIVLDEVQDRNANFLSIGNLVDGMVPISFYGMV